MKNGRYEHHDDPKITSIADARKRAEAAKKAKAAAGSRFASGSGRGGPLSARDWIVGIVIVAMAVGMLVYWTLPLWLAAASLGK